MSRVTEVDFNNNDLAHQRTISFGYDFADRVTGITDTTNGGTPTQIAYQYGGLDNITEEDTAEGSIVNGYDDNGRRISMHSTFLGTALPTVSFAYYNDDQIQRALSGSLGTYFNYDGDGRRSIKKVSGVGPNFVNTVYAYDADSRVCAMYYGDDVTQLSNWTCTGVTGPTLGNLAYSYDQDSRVVRVDGGFAHFNLHAPTTATATYTQTEQLQSWNGVTAQSDDASNLTTDPSSAKTYTWDSRNELSQISPGPNGNLQMTYDALGRRRQKSSVTQYTNFTTSYLYDGGAAIASSGVAAGNWTMRGPGGEIFIYNDTGPLNPGFWVPLQDASGSTIATINSSGAISTQYTYDANGNTSTSGSSNSLPYLYGGMELDTESGLYHAGTQYYSPQLTRPLSQIGATGAGGGFGGGPSGGAGGSSSGQGLFGVSSQLGLASGAGYLTASGLASLGSFDAAGFAIFGAAAGPVGAVVAAGAFALQQLLHFDLFDALLGGGSPGLPWELHAADHGPAGLLIAGTRDVPCQNYPRPLTDCEKSKLARFIPQADLDSAIIHDSGWVSIFGQRGITIGNDIYLDPNEFNNGTTTQGLALLGHELVHVGQYKQGMTVLGYVVTTLLAGGHDNSPYEIPAIQKEDEIAGALAEQGQACGCK